MDFYGSREPVGQTCPDINALQKALKEIDKLCNVYKIHENAEAMLDRINDIQTALNEFPEELEKLRSANASLRNWGLTEEATVKQLEAELIENETEKQAEIRELTNKIADYEDEIRDLKLEILGLEESVDGA